MSVEGPGSVAGHLGTSWEIAVVVVVVVVVIAIVCVVIFQVRRRRQRRAARGQLHLEHGASEKNLPQFTTEPPRYGDRTITPISRPAPVASSHRRSRSSELSQKPPRYYWDQR